jgi:hypothetical protein
MCSSRINSLLHYGLFERVCRELDVSLIQKFEGSFLIGLSNPFNSLYFHPPDLQTLASILKTLVCSDHNINNNHEKQVVFMVID